MAKAIIDVEDLLVWAYRDQRIDRMIMAKEKAPTELSSYAAGFGAFRMMAELGFIIASTGDSSMTDAIAEDAQRINAAVLSLSDMFLEVDAEGVRVWDRQDEEAEGFRIRQTARGYEVRRPDGFVRPVTQAVTSILLILHARNATRPECHLGWLPGRPTRIDARGRRVVDHDAAEITADEVSEARAQYHVWRTALIALAASLEDRLELFTVTGPRAPEAPWLTYSGPVRVLDGNRVCRACDAKSLRAQRNLAA